MRKRTLLAGLMVLLLGPSAWSLELNAATVNELTSIGVSHDLAERLVDYRETHGDFLSSGDALKVQGMTQGQLNQLRSSLTIDGRRVTTPSGTAPAIPGASPAVPAHKVAPPTVRHRARVFSHRGRRGDRHPAALDDETSGAGGGQGRGHGRGGGHGHGGGHGRG